MGARFPYSHLQNIRRRPFFSVLQNFAWNTHYEPNFGQNLLGVGVFDSHGKSARDGPLRFLMGSKNTLFGRRPATVSFLVLILIFPTSEFETPGMLLPKRKLVVHSISIN
jgi:hypothetical protein